MRLINATKLRMEEFIGDQIPPYFILSHRWGEGEITYKDFIEGRRQASAGHKKVISFCNFVLRHFGQSASHAAPGSDCQQQDLYVWIDTCCIDKSSSAELTEDINSMYNYYQRSIVCFVYLVGIDLNKKTKAVASASADRAHAHAGSPDSKGVLWTTESKQPFRPEWFSRGWTLQELLAPDFVVFLDREWRVIGRKKSDTGPRPRKIKHGAKLFDYAPNLNAEISKITGIPEQYLLDREEIRSATIAEKMSWAANRKTTRREDRAYSLLGLFDVNMPLLYGEGPRAFVRLQKELIATRTDQSIFAWWLPKQNLEKNIWPGGAYCTTAILAPDPACFQYSGTVSRAKNAPSTKPYAITNAGLELHAKVRRLNINVPEPDLPNMPSPRAVYSTKLNCVQDGQPGRDRIRIAIVGEERKVRDDDILTGFRRLHCLDEGFLDEENETGGVEDRTFYIHVVNPVPGKNKKEVFGME